MAFSELEKEKLFNQKEPLVENNFESKTNQLNKNSKIIKVWAFFDRKSNKSTYLENSRYKYSTNPSKIYASVNDQNNFKSMENCENSTFDRIICNENKNELMDAITFSIRKSLTNQNRSFLLLGVGDKLPLFKLIICCLIEELQRDVIEEIELVCSKNVGFVLKKKIDIEEEEDSTFVNFKFKLPYQSFGLIHQIFKDLDVELNYSELFCSIQFEKSEYFGPTIIKIASSSIKQKLIASCISNTGEMNRYDLINQIFKNSFGLNQAISNSIVDDFTKNDIQVISCFSGKIKDHLENEFLLKISNCLKKNNYKKLFVKKKMGHRRVKSGIRGSYKSNYNSYEKNQIDINNFRSQIRPTKKDFESRINDAVSNAKSNFKFIK